MQVSDFNLYLLNLPIQMFNGVIF